MSGLPTQLKWSRFVCVLTALGYSLHKSGSGSARTFYSPHRSPMLVTFHEPHGSDTLRLGTLRSYLRQLLISPREFLELLKHC